jgi:predicted CXXCH cytochrome family protein
VANNNLLKSIVITLFIAVSVFAAVTSLRSNYAGIRAGKADENYIKSTDCLACHESRFNSWDKTHHSKMTQIPSSKSVLGDFTQTFEYQGIIAKPEQIGEDFYINFTYPNRQTERNKLKYTIGSRRIQQYTIEKDGKIIRLPIAWHIAEKRWISMNGAFFYPDERPFDASRTQWDTNCVFCHNVKAQPNLNFQTKQAKTEVAELGVACGSCHAQGAEHADKFGSPLARMSANGESKIVNPNKIDADRSTMICGHCHGQRVPAEENRIREIMTKGDPFDAGEDLSAIYKPIHADTKLGNLSFETRFWADGSPRLTAYEYQGLLASPCFINTKSNGHDQLSGEKISCASCHTMHEGDVNGMITEEKRTNQACTQCHTQFETQPALAEHTKHDVNSSGSSCYACHMPEIVYGVMDFHKSHQISNPQPELTATKAVPNACNQCHVEKSVNWAIEKTKLNWFGYKDSQTVTDAQFNQPEGVRSLFAGDSLTRALAAYSIEKHGNLGYFAPFLVEAFQAENYPIVRYFTANGLVANDWNIEKPDYLADSAKRKTQIDAWFDKIEPSKRTEIKRIADELRAKRKDADLEIGE